MLITAGMAAGLWSQRPAAARRAVHPPLPQGSEHAVPVSLLDALPRVREGGYTQALTAARARGPAGAADALWIEFFYGAPEAQAAAERSLAAPRTGTGTASDTPEMAFLRFLSAYTQGQDRQMLQAAL
ncbi:MAG: hypothetical protein ACRD2D_06545, partial [Terriglobales bacterium]